ncbi:MAG: glutathione peroxidase [Pseudomonadota bacterium]|nr:glutathione peroxidase [Pseudomonadota bacterium]
MHLISRTLLAAVCALSFICGVAKADDIAHDFNFTSIDGDLMLLSDFKGKVLLVVNTASRCGFTPQYSALQSLWSQYRNRGLVVLGIPSNDFGDQEPGTVKEIKTFCEINYDIDFPMTEKEHVRGENAHPFYRWAARQTGFAGKPRWNFHKYLIDQEGKLVDWFSTTTKPTAAKIIKAIEAILPKNNNL